MARLWLWIFCILHQLAKNEETMMMAAAADRLRHVVRSIFKCTRRDAPSAHNTTQHSSTHLAQKPIIH
uniref:Putative secreted peptide n=1 Tax=Anopheles braziliensis TaxID=58242 RepID=A0A2M3ZX63_9DIPT